MIFGISTQALMSQLLVGLINGSFYALLSLGLAIIFGLLNIVNFAHGALYTLGAFVAWFLLEYAGIGYWGALILSPLVVGLVGAIIERLMLKPLHGLDPLYGLLLTFGLALIIQGLFLNAYGSSGLPYSIPETLAGGINLGFMFLPSTEAGSSFSRSRSVSRLGTSPSEPALALTCAPRPRIPAWSKRLASTSRR